MTSRCFNCGSKEHQRDDCPYPKPKGKEGTERYRDDQWDPQDELDEAVDDFLAGDSSIAPPPPAPYQDDSNDKNQAKLLREKLVHEKLDGTEH